MKTKITLLLLSIIIALPALADGLWGAKASFDINAPGKWHIGETSFVNYHSGYGFSVGGVYSHYFTDNFFLEPSLSVFYDTYKEELVIGEGIGGGQDPLIYKVGLRIPLVAGYTFDITDTFALSVFTGPELNCAFAGRYRLRDKSLNAIEDLDLDLFGKGSSQRRFTCAWKGGIGFPFSDWRVDFEAAFGLTDMIKGPASCKENRISLSLLRYF